MTRKEDAQPPKKRPYTAPTLTRHGDLRTMTLAKGGNKDDGVGVPKTQTTGPG